MFYTKKLEKKKAVSQASQANLVSQASKPEEVYEKMMSPEMITDIKTLFKLYNTESVVAFFNKKNGEALSGEEINLAIAICSAFSLMLFGDELYIYWLSIAFNKPVPDINKELSGGDLAYLNDILIMSINVYKAGSLTEQQHSVLFYMYGRVLNKCMEETVDAENKEVVDMKEINHKEEQMNEETGALVDLLKTALLKIDALNSRVDDLTATVAEQAECLNKLKEEIADSKKRIEKNEQNTIDLEVTLLNGFDKLGIRDMGEVIYALTSKQSVFIEPRVYEEIESQPLITEPVIEINKEDLMSLLNKVAKEVDIKAAVQRLREDYGEESVKEADDALEFSSLDGWTNEKYEVYLEGLNSPLERKQPEIKLGTEDCTPVPRVRYASSEMPADKPAININDYANLSNSEIEYLLKHVRNPTDKSGGLKKP